MNTATAAAPVAAPEATDRQPQIAVLDRGFVYVGYCSVEGGTLTVTGAQCIRRWGTSRGLGELALEGPKANTKLDPAGTLHAPVGSVVHLIDAVPAVWDKHLAGA
ncbi:MULTISPECIES: hypothetical protein [unclassified Paracoccus (in: a-proteobacteria)]|uniref:hypothetical protein n=1 Tax=unclassified Paracoccus (in: a-proteobacteria) TaxID=2688777 RepID=UPI0012B20A3D|nr:MULTISPECIES: hypothetical protein [unclassified Paracoccus (in: a-proteobacteria)]UXU73670.1 hypothetical protein GB879_006885 [Paracoccus sp. SMMA_5]UXU79559.1 hypothetical protein GB880_006870 [Paracoccus sp. SMMA_5_TC]